MPDLMHLSFMLPGSCKQGFMYTVNNIKCEMLCGHLVHLDEHTDSLN